MKILILAQTPPPYHGQAIMQKYLIDAKWDWCEKVHIRLNYSNEISEVGKFKFSKIFSLFKIIFAVWKERLKGEIDLVYYPPSGPNRIPFYRDIITLLLIKRTTKRIIFHFHAGGINNLLERLNPLENILAKFALQAPDASIVLLDSLKKEITWFISKRIYVVPNGIPDISRKYIKRENHDIINILTVGLVSEEKGIFTILETAKLLRDRGIEVKWKIIGAFVSKEIKDKCYSIVKESNLQESVNFMGEKFGEEKWNFYSNSDIFVFCSYYPLEVFPVVLLEAMMFSLPIIATDWRGIPEIIEEGKNGFLVPVNDPNTTAEKIELLFKDSSRREMMGKKGREIFLEKFTLKKHLYNIEKVFKAIVAIDE